MEKAEVDYVWEDRLPTSDQLNKASILTPENIDKEHIEKQAYIYGRMMSVKPTKIRFDDIIDTLAEAFGKDTTYGKSMLGQSPNPIMRNTYDKLYHLVYGPRGALTVNLNLIKKAQERHKNTDEEVAKYVNLVIRHELLHLRFPKTSERTIGKLAERSFEPDFDLNEHLYKYMKEDEPEEPVVIKLPTGTGYTYRKGGIAYYREHKTK